MVYMAIIAAIVSGSVVAGVLFMMCFGLGTTPIYAGIAMVWPVGIICIQSKD